MFNAHDAHATAISSSKPLSIEGGAKPLVCADTSIEGEVQLHCFIMTFFNVFLGAASKPHTYRSKVIITYTQTLYLDLSGSLCILPAINRDGNTKFLDFSAYISNYYLINVG